MMGEGHSDKVTCEQSPEGNEGMNHVDILEKRISGEGAASANILRRSPCLGYLRDSKKARAA